MNIETPETNPSNSTANRPRVTERPTTNLRGREREREVVEERGWGGVCGEIDREEERD